MEQELYRWVKASERLPEIGDYYFCKVDTKKDCVFETIVEWGEHKNGEHKYNDWDLENVSHFGDSIGEDAEVISWLEPLPEISQDEMLLRSIIISNLGQPEETIKELSKSYHLIKK